MLNKGGGEGLLLLGTRVAAVDENVAEGAFSLFVLVVVVVVVGGTATVRSRTE